MWKGKTLCGKVLAGNLIPEHVRTCLDCEQISRRQWDAIFLDEEEFNAKYDSQKGLSRRTESTKGGT